jgi:hypothetical protein
MAMTGASQQALTILDTRRMPWEGHILHKGSLRKILSVDPATGGYVHLRYFPPGAADQTARVYHCSVRESFFFLSGDYPCWEFTSPADHEGRILTFRQNTYMDRHPLGLHARPPGVHSETGSEMLMWCSHGGNFDADPKETIRVPFEGDFAKFGNDFTDPLVVETDTLPWQPHARAGLKIRSVAASSANGAGPVALVYLPPGWAETPSRARIAPGAGRQFIYVLWGSFGMHANGKEQRLDSGSFIEWLSPTEVALGRTPVAEEGCVLLCVGHDLGA